MQPVTMADLASAVQTDTTQIAADQATVAADQLKLATDQAAVQTDDTTLSADQVALGDALSLSGPFGILSADGASVLVYSPGDETVPYTTSTIPLGSSVPIPVPPALPGPTS